MQAASTLFYHSTTSVVLCMWGLLSPMIFLYRSYMIYLYDVSILELP
jgi:hypothetical protein